MQGPITIQDRYIRFTTSALHKVIGFTNTAQAIEDKSISFKGYILNNADASVRWLQIYFRPSTEVIVGTTPPDLSIQIAPTSTTAMDFSQIFKEGTGLSVAASTTETGSIAPTIRVTGTLLYSK